LANHILLVELPVPRVVSFIVLLAIILLIGSMFFQVMVQFIVPLFLAAVLVVIFKPLHLWVRGKCGHEHIKLSAAVTTILIVMIVLLPISAMLIRAVAEAAEHYTDLSALNVAAKMTDSPKSTEQPEPTVSNAPSSETENKPTGDGDQLDASGDQNVVSEKADSPKSTEQPEPTESNASLISETENDPQGDADLQDVTVDTNSLLAVIDQVVPKINEHLTKFNLPNLVAKDVRDYLKDTIETMAAPLALGGVRVLVSTLFSMAIMVLTLYYFFADGPNMVTGLMKLSPLDDTYEQELLDKFADVSRSVVVAILLSAIAQGILAGIGYFFAGVQNVFLCTVATCFLAMVPFVGATVVWVPICLILYFYVGYTTAAIVLAIYCLTVVSMVDNIIKPLVLHGQANLHPLLALLSVIGGIQVLGPIGILVGPMLVAFLQALLNMLNKELQLLGQESDATGKPVVFATAAAGQVASDPPVVLPKSKPQRKRKRKKK